MFFFKLCIVLLAPLAAFANAYQNEGSSSSQNEGSSGASGTCLITCVGLLLEISRNSVFHGVVCPETGIKVLMGQRVSLS
ncbi:hypothetical protein BGW80DRAFT_1303250 [Lactifluus volemus]|nr:hypothetical protein BGW80DRAFT_1303250 [Lactifluus volemus]